MSRRRAAVKREIDPDAKFGDMRVAKVINCMMYAGKKSVAEKIMYKAMDRIDGKDSKPSLDRFHEALDNIKPLVEVRSRRVGGATYQVPSDVRTDRSQALAIRWLLNSARSRSEKTMDARLAGELMDASNNRGAAVKKREDTHKMAEANKAYSHFKW